MVRFGTRVVVFEAILKDRSSVGSIALPTRLARALGTFVVVFEAILRAETSNRIRIDRETFSNTEGTSIGFFTRNPVAMRFVGRHFVHNGKNVQQKTVESVTSTSIRMHDASCRLKTYLGMYIPKAKNPAP
jgi:hypothetical protein